MPIIVPAEPNVTMKRDDRPAPSTRAGRRPRSMIRTPDAGGCKPAGGRGPEEGSTAMEHGVPAPAAATATGADFPTRARVAVIGGGIVGASVAYHLTERGWTDVVLLERKRLTSGTTWHAAGLVGQIRATYNMTMLARYALELFTEVERRTGMGTGFRRTGSILLAATEGRLDEVRRNVSMARLCGVDAEMIDGARAAEMFPLLDPAGVLGAAWIPGDGVANPTDVTQAVAKAARLAGARIIEHTKVTAVHERDGHVTGVSTDRGDIACEYVVELHRHVGPRAGRPERRGDPEPRRRALLPDHRGDPGPRPGPARAPLARRRGLPPRRHEQAHGRVLRARRQALGDPRHPRGRGVRHPARGLGPHHPVPRAGRAARAHPRRGRLPAALQRAGELHPRRPLRPGRGARPSRLLRRGRVQLGRVRRAAAAPAGRSPTGWSTTAPRWTSGRSTSGGSCRSSATAATSTSGPPRRSACSTTCTGRSASTRPRAASVARRSTTGSRRPGRLLRRGRRLGAGELVRARRRRAALRVQLRPPELVPLQRRGAPGRPRGRGLVRPDLVRQAPGPGPRRTPDPRHRELPADIDVEPGRHRLHPVAERSRRRRGGPDRHAAWPRTGSWSSRPARQTVRDARLAAPRASRPMPTSRSPT